MSLHVLLLLQGLYGLAGCFYNLISYRRQRQRQMPLAPTNAIHGIAAMLAYLLTLNLALSGYLTLYRWMMLLALLMLGYGGVVAHWLRRRHINSQYASRAAWYWAIGINMFGAVLNSIAAATAF